MRKELQEQLVSKFPNLYINDRFDGFWVDDSWYDLIYNLSSDISGLISSLPTEKQSNYKVVQIKEKFGSLRYYMSGITPDMNEIITTAEMESDNICYSCCGKIVEKEIEFKSNWNINHCKKCSIIKKLLE